MVSLRYILGGIYVMCQGLDASLVSMLVIFLFKQKAAYEMRISDWSSDVCSSDLRDFTFIVKKPSRSESSFATFSSLGVKTTSRPQLAMISSVTSGDRKSVV